MRKVTFIACCLSFFVVSIGSADELGFESTQEGIVRELTRSLPGKSLRTRSLSIPDAAAHPRGLRAIVVEEKEGKEVKEEVVVSSFPTAPSVNLKILFDYDSYRIRPDSYAILNELGKAVTAEVLIDRRITIKGHTDSDGTEAYNLTLSLNRALAVKHYLIGNFSISGERLRVMALGEAVPLAPNTSPKNKQLNRRVEIQAE